MNTFELQHRFNIECEKYGISDPVMSAIVEDYINYAYQYYITEKFDSLINPAEKFEITERISRILAPLLLDYEYIGTGTPITTNSPYGISVTLPSNAGSAVQYIVKEKAVINYTDCNGAAQTKQCKVIPIKHNAISSNLDNPFLKPEDDEIWRVNIFDNKVELILYAGVTLYSYTCRYLKKHNPVVFLTDTTMEIDTSVHEEIVVKAVYMYLTDLRKDTTKKEQNV